MRTSKGVLLLTSVTTLLTVTACGSSGGHASASSTASAGAGAVRGGFAAYAACLRQHGAKVSTSMPSGRPSGGGGISGISPEARQACQSLAPQRRGLGMQQTQAFRTCLSDHGVTLPTPRPGTARSPGTVRSASARRSPGTGMFGTLDTTDPKVAAALRICRPLLPTSSPRPSAS